MNQQVKLTDNYRNTCIREMLANSEFVHERTSRTLNLTDLIHNSCCVYNKWEQCIVDQITDKCGSDAGEVFPYLIKHVSVLLFHNMCPMNSFGPNNVQQCDPKMFVSPNGTLPKGYKSKSMMSHYFSYICPNVAYGIDDGK